MKYIHFGNDHFNINSFENIRKGGYFNKPFGGFWSSPVNSNYGWKHFCKDHNFGDLTVSFEFELKEDTKILTIDSLYDLKQICSQFIDIDFASILEDYDAIYLTEKGFKETHLSTPNLYGWDCETLLVLNKNVIIS